MSATDRLSRALDALEDSGQSWPCRGQSLWLSDDHQDREAAALGCLPCPLIAECRSAALEVKATAGVWGGRPFGVPAKTGRKKTSPTKGTA